MPLTEALERLQLTRLALHGTHLIAAAAEATASRLLPKAQTQRAAATF
jgi:hypothetical protein